MSSSAAPCAQRTRQPMGGRRGRWVVFVTSIFVRSSGSCVVTTFHLRKCFIVLLSNTIKHPHVPLLYVLLIESQHRLIPKGSRLHVDVNLLQKNRTIDAPLQDIRN